MSQLADSPTAMPATALPTNWSLADVQKHVGGVPLNRIRLYPPPGMATEKDVLDLDDHHDRLCELVDGILVEKVMSSYESMLALLLGHLIQSFLDDQPLGALMGPDGMLWILPEKLHIPAVSFISWDRFPGGKIPEDAVFRVAPDLAVEILSKGNPKSEMKQKLREYFQAGVRLVWYIDPRKRSAEVYTAIDQVERISEDEKLNGRDVLPGFELVLGELFAKAEKGSSS